MKKVYATMLVAALGAGSLCAQDPVLSTVWTKAYDMEVSEFDPAAPDWGAAGAIKTQAGMHNAIGIDGKLYAIDMRTMSVTAFDANGATKAFDLPSLAGKTLTYVTLDADGNAATCADYYGSLISRDDAGHLLVGHGYNTGAINYVWTVLDRNTGETKRLDATPTAPNDLRACLPHELVARGIGDVTKEGYLYLAPTSIYWPYAGDGTKLSQTGWGNEHLNVQRIKMLSFTGDGTVAGTNMSLAFSGPVPMANWLLTTPAPWYSSVEAMKEAMAADPTNVTMDQTFYFYSKLQCSAGGQWDVNCGLINPAESYKLIFPNEELSISSEMFSQNWSGYQGFDTFELGGQRYYVSAFNGDAELKNDSQVGIAIFDAEGYFLLKDNTEVTWKYDGEWTDEGQTLNQQNIPDGNLTLNIEKVDDENVNIYVWAEAPGSGVVASMLNFGNGNSGTGVNDVIAEASNEAPVYYNLNGIRVENPANGIFIKKCGSKVTKVVK